MLAYISFPFLPIRKHSPLSSSINLHDRYSNFLFESFSLYGNAFYWCCAVENFLSSFLVFRFIIC